MSTVWNLIQDQMPGVHGLNDLFGVVLSFMMAVTTLSLPSLIMLKKAVRPKLFGKRRYSVHKGFGNRLQKLQKAI